MAASSILARRFVRRSPPEPITCAGSPRVPCGRSTKRRAFMRVGTVEAERSCRRRRRPVNHRLPRPGLLFCQMRTRSSRMTADLSSFDRATSMPPPSQSTPQPNRISLPASSATVWLQAAGVEIARPVAIPDAEAGTNNWWLCSSAGISRRYQQLHRTDFLPGMPRQMVGVVAAHEGRHKALLPGGPPNILLSNASALVLSTSACWAWPTSSQNSHHRDGRQHRNRVRFIRSLLFVTYPPIARSTSRPGAARSARFRMREVDRYLVAASEANVQSFVQSFQAPLGAASNGRSGCMRNASPAPSNNRPIEPANGQVQLPVRSIR